MHKIARRFNVFLSKRECDVIETCVVTNTFSYYCMNPSLNSFTFSKKLNAKIYLT